MSGEELPKEAPLPILGEQEEMASEILCKGHEATLNGEISVAIKLYSQVLQLDCSNKLRHNALSERAICYFKLGMIQAAINDQKQLDFTAGQSNGLTNDLDLSALQKNRYLSIPELQPRSNESATDVSDLVSLNASIRSHPNDTLLLYRKCIAYINSKKFELAEQIGKILIEMEPDNADFYHAYSNATLGCRHYTEAYEAARKALLNGSSSYITLATISRKKRCYLTAYLELKEAEKVGEPRIQQEFIQFYNEIGFAQRSYNEFKELHSGEKINPFDHPLGPFIDDSLPSEVPKEIPPSSYHYLILLDAMNKNNYSIQTGSSFGIEAAYARSWITRFGIPRNRPFDERTVIPIVRWKQTLKVTTEITALLQYSMKKRKSFYNKIPNQRIAVAMEMATNELAHYIRSPRGRNKGVLQYDSIIGIVTSWIRIADPARPLFRRIMFPDFTLNFSIIENGVYTDLYYWKQLATKRMSQLLKLPEQDSPEKLYQLLKSPTSIKIPESNATLYIDKMNFGIEFAGLTSGIDECLITTWNEIMTNSLVGKCPGEFSDLTPLIFKFLFYWFRMMPLTDSNHYAGMTIFNALLMAILNVEIVDKFPNYEIIMLHAILSEDFNAFVTEMENISSNADINHFDTWKMLNHDVPRILPTMQQRIAFLAILPEDDEYILS